VSYKQFLFKKRRSFIWKYSNFSRYLAKDFFNDVKLL